MILYVERDADQPCCSSCQNETRYWEETGEGPGGDPDRCCCVHGGIVGRDFDHEGGTVLRNTEGGE